MSYIVDWLLNIIREARKEIAEILQPYIDGAGASISWVETQISEAIKAAIIQVNIELDDLEATWGEVWEDLQYKISLINTDNLIQVISDTQNSIANVWESLNTEINKVKSYGNDLTRLFLGTATTAASFISQDAKSTYAAIQNALDAQNVKMQEWWNDHTKKIDDQLAANNKTLIGQQDNKFKLFETRIFKWVTDKISEFADDAVKDFAEGLDEGWQTQIKEQS